MDAKHKEATMTTAAAAAKHEEAMRAAAANLTHIVETEDVQMLDLADADGSKKVNSYLRWKRPISVR